MRTAFAAAFIAVTAPMPRCIAEHIEGDTAVTADAAPPPTSTAAPTRTVAIPERLEEEPPPGTRATTTATTTAKRAPPTPPSAAPPTTTTAPAGRRLEFSAGHGQYGYLYPRQTEFITVAQSNVARFHKCFEGVTDSWSVRIQVNVPANGGPLTFPMSITHEGSPDSSPQGKAILDCHLASIKTWPWPASGGIQGQDGGGPGYLVISSGMFWRSS